MKLEHRKGLVRGVVEIRDDREEFEPIKAYTYWYRHDEPNLEEKIDVATYALIGVYSKMDKQRFTSAVISAEWRDYGQV